MMIKICGITTREDAVAAVGAGASALGFNFCEGSPRRIDPLLAAEIGDGLNALKVGVFVDVLPEDVMETAEMACLDVVQLHGSEDPADFSLLRVWKAFRVSEGWSPDTLARSGAEAFVLDGPAPGTGTGFDWSRASGLPYRIILAGGLAPDNVADAIRQVHPWGVDACSKLEKSPGIKDHEKVRQFIHAAASVSL